MEELDIKIDNLIKVIEKNENVINITKLNKIIKEDKKLQKLIEEFNNTNDEKIKDKILSNNNFKDYKKEETEINLLIMYINQKLKEITKKNGCV